MRLTLAEVGPQPAAAAYRFTRQQRLLTPQQFQLVFRRGRRRRIGVIEVITLPNTAGLARLGLVISKRALRRAVDRNRVRRWARDAFRLRQQALPAADIVLRLHGAVLARADVDAAFDHINQVHRP
ncbi:MAG: ribonuclease P protein component [Immundisolibacter sp.]|uniref:ribonuclease P protein component n=1 Tax=Immundisolibacter sp. TaxID=1934948 RepID=UPI003D1298E4